MDEYRVKLSNIRIAPRKARLVADLIRNTDVDEATYQLQYSTKRASEPILKLINSAVANAKVQNSSLNPSTLFIREIRVDEGVTLKRFRPVSRGRAHPIAKKTSHITLILSTKSSPDSSQNRQGSTEESQVPEASKKDAAQPKQEKQNVKETEQTSKVKDTENKKDKQKS